MLILFTFCVAGMSLFGEVAHGDAIGRHANFEGFYLALMTLFTASTGDSWNGIMHDCSSDQGLIGIFFWLFFCLVTSLIFMNVFIAVIGESFDEN